MNYRHSYHAGSFADVFKHVALVALIRALENKPKPFCYLDTHAGAGRYDLQAENAQKTQEFATGVLRLWQLTALPEFMQDYWSVIVKANQQQSYLRCYPGSPYIVRQLLRPKDRMILTELHPEEAAALKQEFFRDKQVAIHHLAAYQALKAFLPPPQHRGLVFIDPPFEQSDEFARIIESLKMALQRWSSGIYAIWFPIKERKRVTQFYHELKQISGHKILSMEFGIYPEDSPLGLNASGMVIVNPPWKIEEQLMLTLPWLWQSLSPNRLGGENIKWLLT